MEARNENDCKMSGKYKAAGVSVKNDIHLFTPCGGRGNCAKCKVKVIEGKARINTMDRIWLSEKELEKGYRLGCHLFTEEPLVVEV